MADKKKILLVEDDLNTRNIYSEILVSGGFDVDSAVDGEDGLEKAENNKYSLILLDVMMPKTDGLEVLARLRNGHNPAKIIIFSNLSHPNIIEDAKKIGVDDFIIKSDVDPGKLLERVKTLLS